MISGKKLADWLKDITEDQNLNDIDELTLNTVDGKRRWWPRRDLSPTLRMGVYDPDTGKYVLGSPSEFYTWESEFTTASVASLTLTCPTARRLEIYQVAGQNATQASDFSMTNVVGGSTLPITITFPAIDNQALNYMIGNITGQYPQPPLGLSPGDTSTITANTFAAGNNTEFWFYYKQFVLA